MSVMFVELPQIRNLYASLGDIVSLILADISSFLCTYCLEKLPVKGTSCSYRALLVVIDPHDLPCG